MKFIYALWAALWLLLPAVHGQETRARGDAAAVGTRQTTTYTGLVLDNSGAPVAGAAVALIDETGRAVAGDITDATGRFSIAAPAGNYKMRFTYQNNRQEIAVVSGQTEYNVTLETSVNLDEVVVVGFGETTRRDLTAAVTSVTVEAFENISVPSFDNALQGRAPGLQVVASSGQPGVAARVRVRGSGSISGSSEPLFVVDGVIYNSTDFSDRAGPTNAVNFNPLVDINPNDIERVDVLKDASSAAIYGARGANGVILITTKRGKAGKARFDINYYAGLTEATRRLEFTNGPEWLELREELYEIQNGGAPLPPDFNVGGSGRPAITAAEAANNNTDWIDRTLRTGTIQDLSVSVRGGSEAVSYFISGNYRFEQGFLEGNTFERLNTRMNLDLKATERITIGANVLFSAIERLDPPTGFNGGLGAAQTGALPIYPVFEDDGSFYGSDTSGGRPFNVGWNPAAQLANRFITRSIRAFPSVYAEAKLTNWLKARSEFGADLLFLRNLNQFPASNRQIVARSFSTGSPVPTDTVRVGAVNERSQYTYVLNTNNYLTVDHKFNENNEINGTLGFQATYSANQIIGFNTQSNAGFFDPYLTRSTGGLQVYDTGTPVAVPVTSGYNAGLDDDYGFLGYFVRVNYKLNKKYLFGASFRADASSRFGENNRFGFFPSVSAGWVVSDESFLQNVGWISYLKVRATYGLTGNAEIGNFNYLSTISGGTGYIGGPGQQLARFANPDLKWENNQQLDLGFDYEFFKGRLYGTIDLFTRRSSDLIFSTAVQGSTGFRNILANTDIVVVNQGIDVGITGRILNKELKWNSTFTGSFLRNEVTDVGTDNNPDAFEVDFSDSRVIEGEPLGITYVLTSVGVDPATGQELFLDQDGNAVALGIEDPALRRPQGNPYPWLQGGWSNTFNYKGFDLEVFWSFSFGNTLYDPLAKFQIGDVSNNNQRLEILDRWTPTNTDTDVPALTGTRALNSSRFVYDAGFLRLRTVQLGYTLPREITRRFFVERIRLFVAGQNLLLLTDYPGWDPEVARFSFGNNQQNISFASPETSTPQARTFTAGINVSF